MDKNYVVILIVLLISALFWVGVSIYAVQTKVDVNPNATSYTTQIESTFDSATLDKVKLRIANNLPITTDVYNNMVLPDTLTNK
jgi:hypothetical protein